jgi:hypothetical protein
LTVFQRFFEPLAFFFRQFAQGPFGEFKLHDCRNDAVFPGWEHRRNPLPQGGLGEALDPRRRINHDPTTRNLRMRASSGHCDHGIPPYWRPWQSRRGLAA